MLLFHIFAPKLNAYISLLILFYLTKKSIFLQRKKTFLFSLSINTIILNIYMDEYDNWAEKTYCYDNIT